MNKFSIDEIKRTTLLNLNHYVNKFGNDKFAFEILNFYNSICELEKLEDSNIKKALEIYEKYH